MDLAKVNNGKVERRKREVDLSTMVYGKIPPQAKEFEEAILGAVLLDKEAYDIVAEILRPEAFYVHAHQEVFTAMQSLARKSQPLDILTVSEELNSMGKLEQVGGQYYITKLTNSVVSSANTESHCKIVLQKYIQREVIRVCGQAIGDAYENSCDAFDLLDSVEEELSGVGQHLSFGDMLPIDTVIVQAIQQIEEWRKSDSPITGVESGYKDLDRATRGWQAGDLIIFAARPSVGKTALSLNLIRNAALAFLAKKTGQSVAIFSLEMKALMLMLRMLSAESQQLLYKIQTGRLTDDDMKIIYQKGVQFLSRLNIRFDDKPSLTIQKLRSKCRKMKRKNKLGLVVVDYLQLMTPEERAGNREREVSTISRALKNLAQELDVPIIALSQMSREFEKRSAKVPQLSDLRESGSLEQDADVVMFLYGPTEDEMKDDAALINRRYLKICKQRNGVLDTIHLDFKSDIQLFEAALKIPAELGQGAWRPIEEGAKLFIDGEKKDKDEEPGDDLPF